MGASHTKPRKWKEDKIKIELIKALSGTCTSWANVKPNDISMTDVSGYGGNRTYKVTAKISDSNDDASEEVVALHLVGEASNFKKQPFMLHVQCLATAAFASINLGPRRITAKSDQFFINEWVANTKPVTTTDVDCDLAKEIGVLLAHIHQVDTQWYSEHYSLLLEKYPALLSVPKGSSFWYLTGRNWPLLFQKEHASTMDSWLRRISKLHHVFMDAEVIPATAAGQKIVTTHADYHLGNILVSNQNGMRMLKVIDFEQCHVSFAIQDISYFIAMSSFKNPEIKLAFASAYLQEMGFPHENTDAFNLVLDAERCVTSIGFWNPIFEEFVKLKDGNSVDLIDYNAYKTLVVDKALTDPDMAKDIVSNGITKCQRSLSLTQFLGQPKDCGIGITAKDYKTGGNPPKNVPKNCKFLLNWDGTIRPEAEDRWRGLVLGANKSGDIILTTHCNREQRIQLSKDVTESLPITGYTAPSSKPVMLKLKEQNAFLGKAIVRSPEVGTYVGNDWVRLAVGGTSDAVEVYFEKDGSIRFADKPEQAFDCEAGKHHHGTRINSYQFQDESCHKFVRNLDDTISPLENLNVIVALDEDCLQLMERDKIKPHNRLVFDLPNGIGPPPNEIASNNRKEIQRKAISVFLSISSTSHSTPLLLGSHPGKAIGITPLVLDEDIQMVLENKKWAENIPKFKLALCDKNDAPNFHIVSSKYCYIMIDNKDNEEKMHSEEENSCKLVCVGMVYK